MTHGLQREVPSLNLADLQQLRRSVKEAGDEALCKLQQAPRFRSASQIGVTSRLQREVQNAVIRHCIAQLNRQHRQRDYLRPEFPR